MRPAGGNRGRGKSKFILSHTAPDRSEYERLSKAGPIIYDARLIIRTITQYHASDEAWQLWFAAQGTTTVHLSCERLAAAPIDTLKEISYQLGLNPMAANGIAPGVARMTDVLAGTGLRDIEMNFRQLSR